MSYCCEDMEYFAEGHKCPEHEDRFECPDYIIIYYKEKKSGYYYSEF